MIVAVIECDPAMFPEKFRRWKQEEQAIVSKANEDMGGAFVNVEHIQHEGVLTTFTTGLIFSGATKWSR